MKKVEMFGKMDPVPAGVYSEIYSNTQMDIDGRMEIFEVHVPDIIYPIHFFKHRPWNLGAG